MKKVRVFVIHSEKDENTLEVLRLHYTDQLFVKSGEITTLKIDYISSAQDRLLGKDFGKEIVKSIDSSDEIIAVITNNCCSSIWVNQEIGFALGRNRELIPLTEKRMIGKSFGFIHSNIQAQKFSKGKLSSNLKVLDARFSKKYGKMIAAKLQKAMKVRKI